jgi:PAS domain S-box-containing protein
MGVLEFIKNRLSASTFAVLVSISLPLFIFANGLGLLYVQERRTSLNDDLIDRARGLSSQVDQQLDDAVRLSLLLSRSSFLPARDWLGFREEAERILSVYPTIRTIQVTDLATREYVVHTDLPPGEKAGAGPNAMAESPLALKAGKPTIFPVRPLGPTVPEPLIPVRTPVFGGDPPNHVLTVALSAESLTKILTDNNLPSQWIATVIDASRQVAGRTRAAADFLGRPISSTLAERLDAGASGMFPTTSLDGVPVYTVFSLSPVTGFAVSLSIPQEEVDAPNRRLILFVIISGLAVAALGAGVAFVIARRLAQVSESEHRIHHELEKRVQERTTALRNSEERFRSFIENSPSAVALKDLEGRYQLVNRTYTEWLGVGREDIIGRTTFDLHPHAFAKESRLEDEEVLRTGQAKEVEHKVRFADGTIHSAVATKFPVFGFEGQTIGVGLVANDVTLRRKAEAALRESEEKLRGAFANTGIGMMIRNMRDRTLVANDAICRMLGYTREELETLHFNEITHPDDRETSHKLRDRMFGGEFDRYQTTKRLIKKTGEPVWVLNNLSSIRGDDGKPLFNINFYQDLTETKKTEEQLANALKLQALGQLTGGVAHEFNNLLLAITTSLGVLETKLTGQEDLARLVRHALAAAFRGGGLTAQLVSYMGVGRVTPTVLQIDDVIARSTELLRPLLGENVAIQTRFPDGLWSVRVDEGQLHQTLLNLALNARDAMQDGGSLTFEAANVSVDATFGAGRRYDVRPGDYVMMAVSDTGSGMSQEARDRAFDPFFTTKEVGKGTGLGLSMVFGFVRRQSGGFLDIESEIGRGTTVKIYLPRVDGAAASARPEERREAPSPAKRRNLGTILIVEDDALVLGGLREALDPFGYTVLSASTGAEAIALHRSGKPIDLILADITLRGGMDGITVVQTIQKDRPETPVIFMTGHTDDGIMKSGLPKDAVVLRKPFKIGVFLDKARELRARASA